MLAVPHPVIVISADVPVSQLPDQLPEIAQLHELFHVTFDGDMEHTLPVKLSVKTIVPPLSTRPLRMLPVTVKRWAFEIVVVTSSKVWPAKVNLRLIPSFKI